MTAMSVRWKTVRPVAIWTVATSVGIGVSWLGIRPVLDAAVADRLVAFPVTDSGTSSPASSRPPGPHASAAIDGAEPSRTRPGSRPTPSATGGAPPTVTPDGWTVVGPGQYVRSFRLGGGNATVRADHGTMELVSATPNPGYVMTITPGTTRVVVNFATALDIWTLDAAWVDNGPVARITQLP